MSEATLSVVDSKSLLALFGTRDQHLRRIREAFPVNISVREGQLHVEGESAAVAKATEVLEKLQGMVQRYGTLSSDDVSQALGRATNGKTPEEGPSIDVMNAGRKIRPRTPGQIEYVQAIRSNDVVFASGPAGTGKTYLAVALAVAALKQEAVRKIVLVRPA